MKSIRLLAMSGFLFLAAAIPALADPIGFSFGGLPADGLISGTPGSTLGWGYTITNLDPVNWLLISMFDVDPIQFAALDASIFDYPILSPGSTVTVAYDAANFAGLLQMTWDSTAPIGFTSGGNLTLTGQFYDGDPLGGGMSIGPEVSRNAPYSVSVTAPLNSPVPEPGTLVLLSTGLAAIVILARQRKKISSS